MASNRLQDAVKVFKSKVSGWFDKDDDSKKSNLIKISQPTRGAVVPVRQPNVAKMQLAPTKPAYKVPKLDSFMPSFSNNYTAFNQKAIADNQAKIATNKDFTKQILARNSVTPAEKIRLSKHKLWDTSKQLVKAQTTSGMPILQDALSGLNSQVSPIGFVKKVYSNVEKSLTDKQTPSEKREEQIKINRQKQRDKGVAESKIAGEMQAELDRLDPIEDKGFWGNIRNPKWVTRQLGTQVLPMAVTVVPGLIVGTLTKNPALATALIMPSSFTLSAGDTYNEAKNFGADEETAQNVAKAVGLGNALLDRVGLGHLIDRMPGSSVIRNGIIKKFLGNFAKETIQEAGTEGLQQLMQNSIAGYFYDPNRKPLDNVAESIFVAGLMGGGTSFGQQSLQLAMNPEYKPAEIGGKKSVTIEEGLELGKGIEQELKQKLNTPEGPEWDNRIILKQNEQGEIVLEENSFNQETNRQSISQAPLEYVYKVVTPEEYTNIRESGKISNTGSFRFNDPSLLLDKNKGGYIIKINAKELPKGIAPDGDSITFDQPIDASKIEAINGEELGNTVKMGQAENESQQLIQDEIEKFVASTNEITDRGEQSTSQTVDINGEEQSVGATGMDNTDLDTTGTENTATAKETTPMTQEDYQIAMKALAEKRGYEAGDASFLDNVPTNEELAMQQLRSRQGDTAPPTPEMVTETQIAPKSKRFISQLNRMKKSAQDQIAEAKQALETYNNDRMREKIAALPKPQELTVEAREQVGELAQIRDGIVTELIKINGIIAQYDVNKKYSKTMMSLKEMKEYQQELTSDLDTIDRQITDLYNQSQSEVVTPAAGQDAGQVQQELRDYYSAQDEEAVGQAWYEVMAELEIAEAGRRISNGGDYSASTQSTFPQWLPEELRSRKLFDSVMKDILDPATMVYPPDSQPRKQALYNEIISQIDSRAGTDSSSILERITNARKENLETAPDRSVAGGEGTDGVGRKSAFVRGVAAPSVMSKADLNEHIRELKNDIKSIDKQIAMAQEDVREVTRKVSPDSQPELSNQELAMKQLQKQQLERTKEAIAQPVSDPEITLGTVEEVLPVIMQQEPTVEQASAAQAQVQEQIDIIDQSTSERKKRGHIEKIEKDQSVPAEIRERLGTINDSYYDTITNKGTLQEAIDNVANNPDEALARVLLPDEKINDYEPAGTAEDSAATVAEGMVLTRKAIAEGNNSLAEKIIISTGKRATKFAQALQAFNIWSKMSPEGMLRFALKEVELANKKRGKGISKSFSPWAKELKLSQETRDFILERMKVVEGMVDDSSSEGIETRNKIVREVITAIGKEIPPTFSEMFASYRYQGLLSNPLTHFRNLYSNIQNYALIKPIHHTVYAAVDFVASGLTGKQRQAYFSEVPEYYRASIGALGAATSAFMDSFKQGSVSSSSNLDMKMVRMNLMPSSLTVVPRLLEAADQFMVTMVSAGETAALIERGVDPDTAAVQAHDSAMKILYKSDIDVDNKTGQGWVLSNFDRVSNALYTARKVPGVGWIIPFVKTPINYAKAQFEYSPLGILTLPGAKNKKSQFAKALIGSSISTMGLMAAAAGRTTWSVPSDEKERELFYAQGKKPYSVLLGDKWVPANYLGMLGLAFLMPAAIKWQSEESKTGPSDSILENFTKGTASLAKYYANSTPLGGINTLSQVLSGETESDLKAFAGTTTSQIVPLSGLVGWISRLLDDSPRKATGVVEGFMRNIPVLSKNLEPYTSPTGKPQTRNFSDRWLPYSIGNNDPAYAGMQEEARKNWQNNAVRTRLEKDVNKLIEKSTRVSLSGVEPGASSTISANDKVSLATTGLTEAQLKSKTTRINDLMDAYDKLSGITDPGSDKLRNEIKNSIENEGMNFESALESFVMKDIKSDYDGLSPTATAMLEESNKYKLLRGLREKYSDFGMGEDFLNSKYEQYGITPEELIYDDKTALPDDVQLEQIKAEVMGLEGESLTDALMAMRVVSDGTRKPQLTDTIIGKLVKEGMITKAEGNWLKTIGWDAVAGTFKKIDLDGDGDKPNKFSVDVPSVRIPATSKASLGIVSGAQSSEDFRNKISASVRGTSSLPEMPSSLKTQLGIKTTKKDRISPFVGRPVTTLSGLGR